MNCPNCGFTIDQPTSLVQIKEGGDFKNCILCDRPPQECGKMVVGVGAGVRVDCLLLSMEMINNPDKYGAAAGMMLQEFSVAPAPTGSHCRTILS